MSKEKQSYVKSISKAHYPVWTQTVVRRRPRKNQWSCYFLQIWSYQFRICDTIRLPNTLSHLRYVHKIVLRASSDCALHAALKKTCADADRLWCYLKNANANLRPMTSSSIDSVSISTSSSTFATFDMWITVLKAKLLSSYPPRHSETFWKKNTKIFKNPFN